MKKILTVFLSLCLLASLATCFALSSHAEESEEIVVTVGQKFEWNSQSGSTESQLAWRSGGGKSPDGLWKYMIYATVRGIYQPTCYAPVPQAYAWTTMPGDADGVGYARVRDFGGNFHPDNLADIVKVFTCPSGGTIDIQTTIARVSDILSDKDNGTSFAIYLDDQLIYPTSDEYLTLSSTAPMEIPLEDIEVSKNQCIYFQIGSIGNRGSDAVTMSNTITYRKINDSEVDETTVSNLEFSSISENYTIPDLNDDNDLISKKDKGSSAGAIIGIVVGAVAVVGIAAAAVVIVKKKKEE